METIMNREILELSDGTTRFYGGDQAWYATPMKRSAGCGPTTASGMLWYLAGTRVGYRPLCPHEGSERAAFEKLMEDVWHYVTPGMMGLNKASRFRDGVLAYGEACSVALQTELLELPPCTKHESRQKAVPFILSAIERNAPVAFLNLSRGALTSLEGWHWVLITGISPDKNIILVYDQGEQKRLNLALWLNTSKMGGGLVAAW